MSSSIYDPSRNYLKRYASADYAYSMEKRSCNEAEQTNNSNVSNICDMQKLNEHREELNLLKIEAKVLTILSLLTHDSESIATFVEGMDGGISNVQLLIPDADLEIVASLFTSEDPKFQRYADLFKAAKEKLPGYLDHHLSNRIYALIQQNQLA